jgi:bacterioferritin
MLRHWGVSKLGDREYHQSIDEMKDADKLIERILFLDGLPNLQDLDKLLIGENVREILECDLRLEQAGISRLREAIAYCEGVRDFVSRDLFSDILQGEEDQVDFIETQFELIDRIGLERYILLQSGSAD